MEKLPIARRKLDVWYGRMDISLEQKGAEFPYSSFPQVIYDVYNQTISSSKS